MWNTDVYNAQLAKDPSFVGKWGAWVYFMVGKLVYIIDDIGLQSKGGAADPERSLSNERNKNEVWMDQEYEQWSSIPLGPIATEKTTAISSIFNTATQQIILSCKNDDEVTEKYNAMMQDAKKAGLIEYLQERYQQIKSFKAK